MKMYKETLRRLSLVGIPLAIATLVYTIILGGQACFGRDTLTSSTSAIGITPVLVYYVFTAILFALYGFSYQFRRSASDLYHSLPLTRSDLYLSVTLATASWMGATILLNVLAMLGMLLVSGCPFVPAYIPMSILFYFVASMLVYAAAAIGCALSGTYVTALATTGIVLFLPRFIQFILARGVVARVSIVGWLDLPVLLDPTTNIATGLIVMQARNVFYSFIMQWPHILYSLLLAAAELALGLWLTRRRPSESAEHGAGRRISSLVVAGALSLTVLLLITVDQKRLLSISGIAITGIALVVYVIYQMVGLRTVRQVLVTLPCFLLAAGLAYGASGVIDATNSKMLSNTPQPDEIASVVFRGRDYAAGEPDYSTLLIREISFTSDAMKEYVSQHLTDAAERLRDPQLASYDAYNEYQVIEPITLKLKDGRTLKRTIIFRDINALNSLRKDEQDFVTAARAFPTAESIQYIGVQSTFTEAENRALLNTFVAESQAKEITNNEYYRPRTEQPLDMSGRYTQLGDAQTVDGISVAGYVDEQRFAEYYNVRMETPQTVSLLMATCNAHMASDTLSRMKEAVTHINSPLALDTDSMGLDMVLYNVPASGSDLPMCINISLYISAYNKDSDDYNKASAELLTRFSDVLARGKPSDDPDKLFVQVRWNEYSSNRTNKQQDSQFYLSFSAEDQQALLDLLPDWYESLSPRY